MSMALRALAIHASALAALACACGDDGGSSSGAATLTPLTVWVLDERAALGASEAAIAAATVSFDPPGGGARIEKTTDADGRAAFDADFGVGGAAVSAVSNEHALLTKLDVRPATIAARPNRSGKPASDLVIVLPRFDTARDATVVSLGGKISNKRDAASSVDLSASGLLRRSSIFTSEDTYTLAVPRGMPFFLLGHESKKVTNTLGIVANDLLGSFRIDVAARDSDGTVDVDVAKASPLALRATKVNLTIPRGAEVPFGDDARASLIATSVDSQLLLGALKKMARSSDGAAFEAELGVVDVDIAPERPITRAVLIAADGSRSIRVERGVAADGSTIGEFLLPPRVADASRSLADPIPLDGFPSGADLRVDVYAAGQLIWVLEGPPGGLREPTLKLPQPTGIVLSTDVQVFGLTLSALADPISLEPSGEIHRRSSVSREILVRRR